jgi:hypothetical protein
MKELVQSLNILYALYLQTKRVTHLLKSPKIREVNLMFLAQSKNKIVMKQKIQP